MKNWSEIIKDEQDKEYYKSLQEFLNQEYKTKEIYPPKELIFSAFDQTAIENLKVVILGQDPYHNFGEAQGLAFSTPTNIKNPPSLRNILKEIEEDTKKVSTCQDGNLTSWTKQGVLLLNTILTVEKNKPKSHHSKGWEIFTDNILKYISENCENIIFIFWGSSAIQKNKIIDSSKHFILSSPHPSPLSSYRGFFGCKHFSKTNEILKSINKATIVW